MADYPKDAGQSIQNASERDMIRVAVDIALFTIRDEKFQILLINYRSIRSIFLNRFRKF